MEEGREGVNATGGAVAGSDATATYHVAAVSENPNQVVASTTAAASQVVAPPSVTPETVKKKRGRPRKYRPDGTVTMALSPQPISSSAPPRVIDFSTEKRGKPRPAVSGIKHHEPKVEYNNLGEWVACSVGANFTPHIVTVNSGEDVTMKIISFSQQGPRAICILSANGVISSVTLRQPDSSGGTLTYEGRFEILSLSGSFMLTETGGTRGRSGGLSVSLASPDGRVVGGGVAGLLVAASPVQVIVGSFLTGNQLEQKTKKHKTESVPTAAIPVSSTAPLKSHFSSSSSFHGDNWASMPSGNNATDINVSLPVGQ